MKIPVSVAIITKNEERNIRDALESVREFEEIVVVDALSDDKTLDICKEYTDKIYSLPWQGFARQKQFAVDRTNLQWVLVLDADERVTEELKEEIRKRLTEEYFDGYFIPRKNFFLGKWIKHSGWWPDYTLRLFRKDRGRFEDREVHEKVVVVGQVGYFKSPLIHYSYESLSDLYRKIELYSNLSAAEIISKDKYSKAKVVLKMVFSPVFTFLKMFLIRRGFLDGVRGLILASVYSFYTFLKYAKVWESRWK